MSAYDKNEKEIYMQITKHFKYISTENIKNTHLNSAFSLAYIIIIKKHLLEGENL